jgi:serine-rich repeat adhesion-like glycoprotein
MKNIILNSNLKDDYLKLVELYVKNNVYGCQEELALYVIELQKKIMEITPEERELMQMFFTTGQGWVDTKFKPEAIELLKCESEEDCKRIAIILTDDENIINQDIGYFTGVDVIDNNNYDDTMEKVSKVYEEMINNGDKEMKEELKEETKSTETIEENAVEETAESKSNTKWYLLGIAATVAIIGGAAYVYKKFQDKDIVIISSDDL